MQRQKPTVSDYRLESMGIFSFLLILVFLLSTNLSLAQTPPINIDSIYAELKIKPDSKSKVDKLIALYKKSIKQRKIRKDIIENALYTAEKIFYIEGIAKCYNRMGISARYANDYRASVTYHKRALNFLSETTDTLSKIKCLNSLGVTYRKLNLEKDAFNSYFKALKLSEEFKNDRSIAIALNGIGNVFINTEEYNKALPYFKRALKLEVKNKNIKGQEYELANIGEVLLHKQSYDSAYYYLNKSLIIAREHPHKDSEAIKLNLLGLLYQKKGNYSKSLEYYKQSIPLFKDYNNQRYLSNTLINMGVNMLRLKKYTAAQHNILLGLEKAKRIHSKENIILGYKALVDYYTFIKDYKKALSAYKRATEFHDSIINEDSQKNIISTQIEYETAKKDAQIQELANEKKMILLNEQANYKRLIVIIIISLIIIIILVIVFNLRRKNLDLELQNKKSEIQKYLLQINKLKDKVEDKEVNSSQDIAEKLDYFELSKREKEVIDLISKGLSNDEIASKIFVSKNTIKTHIKNIYTKLDVKNRIQAVKKIKAL